MDNEQRFLEAQKLYQKQIADLEAKLTESEKKLEKNDDEWREIYDSKLETINRLIEEKHELQHQLAEMTKKYELSSCPTGGLVDRVRNLEHQLAEKDKELAYMTKQAKKFNNEAQKYYEDAYCNDFKKQDKISFAVEQLTQAKEYINKSLEYMWNNNAEMTCRDRSIIDGIYNKIDNQIRELRGEI